MTNRAARRAADASRRFALAALAIACSTAGALADSLPYDASGPLHVAPETGTPVPLDLIDQAPAALPEIAPAAVGEEVTPPPEIVTPTPPPIAAEPLPAPAPPIDRLEAQIEDMRRALAVQQQEIERLRVIASAPAPDVFAETWKRLTLGWSRATTIATRALRDLELALGPRGIATALTIGLFLALLIALLTRKTSDGQKMRRILALAAPVTPAALGSGPIVSPEFLAKMLKSFDPGLRRRWAIKMAAKPDAPRDLIVAFAEDDFAVAEPVLTDSPLLDEPVLLDLVRRLDSQHRRAIARRRGLSAAVSDALARTEKVDVVAALLRNRQARIAEETMERLVEASRAVVSYREPLARRPDLSPRLAWRLYDWADETLRASLRAKFDGSHIEAEVKAEPPPAPAPQPEAPAASSAPTPHALSDPLRDGDVDRFVAMLSDMTGLAPERVRPMLTAPEGFELAVLCRALDLEPSRFAWIYLRVQRLLGDRPTVDPGALANAVAAHAELPASVARARLADWQRQAEAAE